MEKKMKKADELHKKFLEDFLKLLKDNIDKAKFVIYTRHGMPSFYDFEMFLKVKRVKIHMELGTEESNFMKIITIKKGLFNKFRFILDLQKNTYSVKIWSVIADEYDRQKELRIEQLRKVELRNKKQQSKKLEHIIKT